MSEQQLTHHIQLEILRRMLQRRESRYSDLKPKDVEANLFMYHLKQLIRLGFVEKQDKVYVLTRTGKHYTDRVTLETMKIRPQPKIVIILCVRRADGQWLIQRRKNQPFENFKGFPSGKIHYGETLQLAAEREIRDKANLSSIELQLRGNIVMRFTDGDETVNHVSGYVFYGEAPADIEVNCDFEHFSTYFGGEAELFEEPCFGGHPEILKLLERSGYFVEEYTLKSAY